MTQTAAVAGAPPSVAAPSLTGTVFLTSVASLYLQVALMKLMSVMFYSLFVFAMIGVALLGYGAAGSLLAVRGIPTGPAALRVVARSLLGFAAVVLPVVLLVNAVDVPSQELFGSLRTLPLLVLVYGLLTLPFLLAGYAISAAFAAAPEQANRFYFADLLGAGSGGALAVATLPVLGGLPLIAAAGVMGAIPAGLALRRAGRGIGAAVTLGVINLVALGVFLLWRPIDIHIASDKHGPILSRAAKPPDGLHIDFSQWSRLGRVDITEPFSTLPPQFGGDVSRTFGNLTIEQRMMMIDGAAPAFMYRLDGPPESLPFLAGTSQSPAYLMKRAPRVLIIGVGGATDVLIALSQGASKVHAVELNPVNAHAVRDVFDDYVGHLLTDPRVTLDVAEGRNFAARDTEQYDIVQLSGVDTGLAMGAYGLGTMPESYIYTQEAITDLLERLAPGGMLSITRDMAFGWAYRLCAMVRAALLADGLDPAPRIAVLEGTTYHWATVLVKREPFTEADMDVLRGFSERYGFPMRYDPLRPGTDLFDRVIREGVSADGIMDLRPATDDWPFFFLNIRWGRLLSAADRNWNLLLTPMVFLLVNLAGLTLVAAILIGWPLWRLRSAWRETSNTWAIVGYFAALGAAFMLIEVALMQRFTVFVGNPVLAVATVLSALLVSSGVGSRMARGWRERGRPVVPIAVAWIVVAQLVLASPPVRAMLGELLAAPLGVRLLVCCLLVGAAGIPMGMPFPDGLRRVAERSRSIVPWAWGINAMASVVCSLASYLLGMLTGYTAMCYAGAALYLGALAVARRL